jgi:hypothetical protein
MDEPLLDLGRTHRVKGRGLSISLTERVRAARGMKQAVVKVTGFGRGARGVGKAMDYISREGMLPLEKDSGDLILGREEQKELVKEWSMDFDGFKNSRDTAQIVFSMPPGSKVEALRAAVRTTGERAFPGHEWVFAIHEDRAHPHAHMIVKMRGKEKGKKLQLKKADLRELRSLFAEASREQGVMLAASPRSARGVGQKAERQDIRQLKQRGIRPEVEKKAAQEAAMELTRGDRQEKVWECAMRGRNERERAAYREEARKLRARAAIEQQDQKKQKTLSRLAGDLERFAETMPKPKTRRQVLKDKALEKTQEKQRQKVRQPDRGMDLEL